MKRIDIFYGTQHYSVANRPLADLTREIGDTIQSGGGWLQVNYGDGSLVPAQLYISPGTAIAVAEQPES